MTTSTSPLFHWRGLRSCRERLPFTLRCERGVWGKAAGARSDYRWLARSEGFAGLAGDLERELLLGVEDEPRDSVSWKSWRGSFHAVRLYPSRVQDASGRGDFTEKQVLACTGAAAQEHPALAAFVLLSRVAELDDSVWFDRRKEGSWNDPSYALDIPRNECPEITVTASGLEELVERGLDELAGRTDVTALGELCSQVLDDRTAWLRQVAEPLPAGALAALLLDLAPEQAARLSLTSWIPATRTNPGLTERWNVLVEPAGRSFADSDVYEASRAGEGLARRLLSKRPEPPPVESPLVGSSEKTEPVAAPAAGEKGIHVDFPDLSADPWVDVGKSQPSARPKAPPSPRPAPPKPAQVEASATARRKDREPIEKDRGAAPEEDSRVGVKPGSTLRIEQVSSPAPLLRELYDFARSVDLRRIWPAALRRERIRLFRFADGDAERVRRWVDEVERRPPVYVAADPSMPLARADQSQWAVKVDTLRSAALVLAPRPELAESVGEFRSGRIPPLYMGRILSDDARDDLVDRLGMSVLRKAIAEGLRCSYAPWREETWAWLESWAERTRRRELRPVIRRAR